MSSEAIIGKGVTLGYSDTEGGTYTTLGEITKVTPPGIKVKDVSVTHSESDIEDTIPGGFKDVGTCEADLNYLPSERQALLALAGVEKFWQIVYPDTSTETFQGYINELGAECPIDDKISQKIVIKLQTSPDFEPVSVPA